MNWRFDILSSRMRCIFTLRSFVHAVAASMVIATLSDKAIAFSIDSVSGVQSEQRIEVSVSATIDLSETVIQALRVNVPITIATTVRVYRIRNAWWDELVADYEFSDQISSRSLYRDFVVDSSDEQIVGNYSSLNDALTALGKQRMYVLTIEDSGFSPQFEYRGEVNISLQHSTLPSVMLIPALFDAGWRLYTPWNEFDIT